MTRQPAIRQVILLAALVGLLSQAIFEFGPLWLVALAAPAALFGPVLGPRSFPLSGSAAISPARSTSTGARSCFCSRWPPPRPHSFCR